MKRVRITLELSESFIRLLNANCSMSRITEWLTGGDMPPQLDPIGVLALVVLAEARGAHENQIHAATPLEWRPDIEPVCGSREVVEL